MGLPQKCNIDLARANRLAGEKRGGGAPAVERGHGGAGAQSAGLFLTGLDRGTRGGRGRFCGPPGSVSPGMFHKG